MAEWIDLVPHPTTPCPAVSRLEGRVTRLAGGALRIDYELFGFLEQVALPPVSKPLRRDDLWRHSCFEFFVRGEDATYAEFNFSPSTEWAAYRFDDYRSGMAPLGLADDPQVTRVQSDEDSYVQAAIVTLPDGDRTRMSLAAVIELKDGTKSYWALAHPPGKPDFHDPAGFTLELPPAPSTSSPRT